jgi:hypothetical protein
VLIVNQLCELARERIEDAEALFTAKRYEGAMYICGYAVEIALKARICKTLRWGEFPSESREFNQNQKYQFLKTHVLGLLLSYSAQEERVKTKFSTEWSAVAAWSPESRYTPATRITKRTSPRVVARLEMKARLMIDSAKILLKKL